MMKKQLKTLVRIVCGAALLLLLMGCGNGYVKKDTYYRSCWDRQKGNILMLKSSGHYEIAGDSSGDKGTYTIKDGVLKLVSEMSSVREYQMLNDSYILGDAYEGTVPEGSAVSCTVKQETRGSGIIMELKEDGTVTRRMYITNLSDQQLQGTYKLENGIVSCDFGVYGEYKFGISKGVMYDLYELDPEYTVTPTVAGSK